MHTPIIVPVVHDDEEAAPSLLTDEAIRQGYRYQVKLDDGNWTIMTEREYRKYKLENPDTPWHVFVLSILAIIGALIGVIALVAYLSNRYL